MPQIAYRANLSASTFPMTVAEGGRTVIVPGPDNNFDRRVDPQGEQTDAGIPQALYLENVMPTANGYQSIGFIKPTAPMTVPAGVGNCIGKVVELKVKLIALPGPYIIGPVEYIIDVPMYIWTSGAITGGINGAGVIGIVGVGFSSYLNTFSVAVVRGVCYLYCSNGQIYTVAATSSNNVTLTNVTASVTPLGFFTTEDIISICSSNNYLLCHNTLTTYWSSTTTPLDFVSSLVSGAGSIDPNSSDDAVTYMKEAYNGFYLYALNNIIYAQYTGNARYPWKFTPVKNSTGVLFYPWNIFGAVDTIGHYVIESNNNIRLVQQDNSLPISADISDFLNKTTVQSLFNSSTNTFTETEVLTEVSTIYVHLNRYLFISINGTNRDGTIDEKYTHLIVYDIQLKRVGKIKLDHSFIFTIAKAVNFFSAVVTEESIGFVNKQTNEIRVLNFDVYNSRPLSVNATYEEMQGVLVLGKFQHVRSRFLSLEEIEFEGPQNKSIVTNPNFSCVVLPSLDGRNFSAPVSPYLAYNSGGLIKYNSHVVGQNVSVAAKGAFSLNTLQLKYTIAGNR
mgnify:CR=1 FL=1